jgi:hypothetical protein
LMLPSPALYMLESLGGSSFDSVTNLYRIKELSTI